MVRVAQKDMGVPRKVLLLQIPLASPGGALLFALAANLPRPFFRGARAWALVWFPQIGTMAVQEVDRPGSVGL